MAQLLLLHQGYLEGGCLWLPVTGQRAVTARRAGILNWCLSSRECSWLCVRYEDVSYQVTYLLLGHHACMAAETSTARVEQGEMNMSG